MLICSIPMLGRYRDSALTWLLKVDPRSSPWRLDDDCGYPHDLGNLHMMNGPLMRKNDDWQSYLGVISSKLLYYCTNRHVFIISYHVHRDLVLLGDPTSHHPSNVHIAISTKPRSPVRSFLKPLYLIMGASKVKTLKATDFDGSWMVLVCNNAAPLFYWTHSRTPLLVAVHGCAWSPRCIRPIP